MTRRAMRTLCTGVLGGIVLGSSALWAQEPTAVEAVIAPQVVTTTQTVESDRSAGEVRGDFIRLLRQQPVTVSQVLRIDPGLMLNDQYMAPYPALAAFVAQHPEIPRNPVFFVGPPTSPGGDVGEALSIIAVISIVAGTFIWVLRTILEHRRWSRLARVQTEAHVKLVDRFTSSEDLRAYFESPAGRRFLTSEPVSLETISSQSMPAGKILWSLQMGLVLALGGLGLQLAIPNLTEQGAADPLRVIGTIAIALGIGFMLSSGASLILSRKLGLLAAGSRDSKPS